MRIADELKLIAADLERLRQSGAASKIFGAKVHGFLVNPALPAADVAAFEDQHRVKLPDDYREFLIRVGNGGAGPDYGLFKLGEMDDRRGHARWQEDNGFVGVLARPFPHNDPWNDLRGKPEFDEEAASAQLGYEYEDAYGEQMTEWEASHYWNPRQVDGAIPICHGGCAYRDWLVVSGAEAGHVWCDRRVDEKGLYPCQIGSEPRASFLSWYRNWLDEAIEKWRTQT